MLLISCSSYSKNNFYIFITYKYIVCMYINHPINIIGKQALENLHLENEYNKAISLDLQSCS